MLLGATLALGAGTVIWDQVVDDRAIRSLAALGIAVSEQQGSLHMEATSGLTARNFKLSEPILERLERPASQPRICGVWPVMI